MRAAAILKDAIQFSGTDGNITVGYLFNQPTIALGNVTITDIVSYRQYGNVGLIVENEYSLYFINLLSCGEPLIIDKGQIDIDAARALVLNWQGSLWVCQQNPEYKAVIIKLLGRLARIKTVFKDIPSNTDITNQFIVYRVLMVHNNAMVLQMINSHSNNILWLNGTNLYSVERNICEYTKSKSKAIAIDVYNRYIKKMLGYIVYDNMDNSYKLFKIVDNNLILEFTGDADTVLNYGRQQYNLED